MTGTGRQKSQNSTTVALHPVISIVQRMALYETRSRYYLVGSNNTQTKFRVLKIDRTEPSELVVIDDKMEYNHKEIIEFLSMIEKENRPAKPGQKGSPGLNRIVSAFGIVGFVRFLEGYYMILITKRRRIAIIGHHTIYKIEDTSMVYLPNNHDHSVQPAESRYVKMFQNVDLRSNFYFSYSYDLTHTLQYNLAPLVCTVPTRLTASQSESDDSLLDVKEPEVVESADTWDLLPIEESQRPSYKLPGRRFKSEGKDDGVENTADIVFGNWSEGTCFAGRTKPNWRYVWNSYLLEPVELHTDWLLYITHGFVGQTNISVYGRPIFLTLIARRSQKFSGTRFLKRGANSEGDVANEVETEQIVHDSSVSSFTDGNFTSFVQVRGSVPFSWSQDVSKIVPKPAINLDLVDPYCFAAGRHFNLLLRQYGAPVIALNLVKKREKRLHESLLSSQFLDIIDYLNQFLPRSRHIIYLAFDMARNNKLKEANVMGRLSDIAYSILSKTGLYHSRAGQSLPPPNYYLGGALTQYGARLQTGVARVNCVDCLDRTNTAQFALGKCALAFQLNALGVLPKPDLVFDTDSVRMLEVLYEDHGDTLALQYGGSQLVHRVKTYRKIAPLSSHSRDIMQTLSRYYSNTFSDADKQNAINLFLGVYRPYEQTTPLWDMTTDYYLHNSIPAGKLLCHRNPYTCWFDEEVATALPFALEEVLKSHGRSLMEVMKLEVTSEKADGFVELYRPFEMSVISELFMFNLSHSVRDFMPNSAIDYSPFSVRIRPGKHREAAGGANKLPNPSVTGISSTMSTSSGGSDSDSLEPSDEEPDTAQTPDSNESSSNDFSQRPITFESVFQTMLQTYGTEIRDPSTKDLTVYKRFVSLGRLSGMTCKNDASSITSPKKSFQLIRQSAFPIDSIYEVSPPMVPRSSRDIYQVYVQRGKTGALTPNHRSLMTYQHFVSRRYQ